MMNEAIYGAWIKLDKIISIHDPIRLFRDEFRFSPSHVLVNAADWSSDIVGNTDGVLIEISADVPERSVWVGVIKNASKQGHLFDLAREAYPDSVRLNKSWWRLVDGYEVSGIEQHEGKLILQEKRDGCRQLFNHWGSYIMASEIGQTS